MVDGKGETVARLFPADISECVRHRLGLRGTLALICAVLLLSSQFALAQFTQQGPKLVGTGDVGGAQQGYSVALSADGNTALVGGPADTPNSACNCSAGAAWIFTRSNGVWTQQGSNQTGSSNGAQRKLTSIAVKVPNFLADLPHGAYVA
jgi:hypothetical protein